MPLSSRVLKPLVLTALLSAFAWPVLAAATFVVNSTGDKADQTKGDGICADADGNCTLRAAIEESNALAGTDTINFGIPGAGVHTITPGSALPTIIDPVIIDGTTQAVFAGTPLIELNGTSAYPANGLNISAGSSTIKALCINRFGNGIVLVANGGNTLVGNFLGIGTDGNTPLANGAQGIFLGSAGNTVGGTAPGTRNVVSGNASTGIAINSAVFGFAAGGNIVQGNRIGTNASGTAKVPNGGNGVYVVTSGNMIGGMAAGAGNLISGNAFPDIAITGSGATLNTVLGNIVGLDITGTAKLGSSSNGIVIVNDASSNTIGGTSPGARNVISGAGNNSSGIAVANGLSTTGNMILGNYIGTDATGVANLGNAGNGVFIQAPGNFIGGTTSGAANVISGNTLSGVILESSAAHDSVVQGNRIGVNINGAALGNSKGIVVNSAANNVIGGAAPDAGNIISGNNSYGIEIRNAGATGNTVKGNFIGTLPGDTADRHNGGDGILINATTDNTIGGTAAGEGNAISHNLGNGVTVTGSSAVRNAIRGNAIHDNTGLGIDLGGDGVTANDAGDGDSGPNDLMNFPEGVTATYDNPNNQTVLRGHIDTPSPDTVKIDLFATSKKDTSDHGQGEKYLGTVMPDANGFFCLTWAGQLPFVAAGPPPPTGTVAPPPWVSATATNSSGSTSEFSPTNNAVELIALEVNQAVQDWTNSVPLIKKKATHVRAHIQTTDPAAIPVNVSLQLRGFRSSVELAGSPLSPLNFGVIQAKPDAPSRRDNFSESVNFRLPDSWLDGTIELRFERTDGVLACKEPADSGAPPGQCSDCRASVTFEAGSAIPVKFVLVKWTDAAATVHEWDDAHIDTLLRRLIAIYPVDNLPDITQGLVTYRDVLPLDLGKVNGILENWRMFDGCNSSLGCQRYYYGVIKDANVGGRANGIPGTVASGEMPANPLIYGRNRHAHELGHDLGRSHAVDPALFGPCGNGAKSCLGTAIANTALGACCECAITTPPFSGVFPYFFTLGGSTDATLGPLLSGEEAKMFGLDTSRIPGPVVVDPTQNFELMSYCGNVRWISDFTYKALHATITTLFPPSGLATGTRKALTVQDYLIVRGTINLANGAVSLQPLQRIPASAPPDLPPAGPYTLQLRDGSGGVLSQISFAPTRDVADFPEQPSTLGRFLIPVLFDPAIRQVVVLQGTTVLASLTASAHSPAVQVVYPNGGENITQDPVLLQWTASDADADPLTFTVQYSSDNGVAWKTLALDWPNQTYSVDRKLLKATTNGLIRVIASDGFNTAVDQSDAVFTVPNHAPTVSIISPSAGQSFAGSQQVVFEAFARDVEDGILSGTSLQWTSNVDGALGSGVTLLKRANQLSPGNHTITVTATDSASAASSASVAISVGAAPPVTYADLAVTQTLSPASPSKNSPAFYTITVSNDGRDGATGVTLTDTLPAGVIFGSAGSSQGSCNQSSGTVTCNLGSLADNASATVTITVTPSATGTITNTASASAGQLDPVPANNTSTESTQVWPAAPAVSNPASKAVCAGASASFSVTASGQAPLSYRWRKNGSSLFDGGAVSGAATATLTISPTIASDSGNYDVVVTDEFGQAATSAAAVLTVNPRPSAAIAAPSAVCPNAQGASASVPSAGAGATYAWSITNGTIASGAGTAAITFSAGSTGSVQLNVKVTDRNGCSAIGTKSVPIVAGASCVARNLIPDGRAVGGTLVPEGSIYTGAVVAGRSYCVEVEVPFDGEGTLAGGGPLPVLSVTRADGVTAVGSEVPASCEPGVASRVTFTPTAADVSGGPLQFHLFDSASSGYPYRVRLTETTMFCARWSVNSYTALIDLQNTTGCAVAGQVVIMNSTGVTLTTLPFNLLPGTATQFPVPTGLSAIFGSAILTHDGPPGAILGGIYMAQSGGTGGANFRWEFLPIRSYGATDGR